MPRLVTSQQSTSSPLRVLGGGGDLDFSALTALEPSLVTGVESACITAASTVGGGTTAQDIADALGRCDLILNHRQSYTDTDATTLASVGNAIAGWKGWKSGHIATQSNSSDRPTKASDGLDFDGSTDFMVMTDRPAIRFASGKGIIVRYFYDGGFRLLQKKNGTGVEANSYFMSPSGNLGVAGCFEAYSSPAPGSWITDTGYWDTSVIKRYNDGVKLDFVSPTNGTAVAGNADPNQIYSDNTDSLFIGKRNNPSGSEGHLDGKIATLIYHSTESDREMLEAFVNAYQ